MTYAVIALLGVLILSALLNYVKLRRLEAVILARSAPEPAQPNDREVTFLKVVESASSQDRITVAQHAFDRLPSSFVLLEKLWALQEEALKMSVPALLKREIVKNMDGAVRLYRRACDVEDIGKADGILAKMGDASVPVAEELRKEEVAFLKMQVKKMSDKVEALKKDRPNSARLLRELERIDSSIDKDRLESLADVKKEYDRVSAHLVETISASDESQTAKHGAAVTQYNLRAIEAHKEAMHLFEEDVRMWKTKDFSTGKGLSEIVDLVGGWDPQYLLPATMSYTNTVFGMMFSKLKDKTQFVMTKAMIEEPRKALEKN